MSQSIPFNRIIRPFNKDDYFSEYILDSRYASDRIALIHSFSLLEKDLIKLFDFIDPAESNLNTFSHRLYELLLRAATEFEANCTAIMNANGYTKNGNLNITDYYKINKASRLAEYSVKLNIWSPSPRTLTPFKEWHNQQSFVPLSWYQKYNQVKHDRNLYFSEANLENLLTAMSGVFIVLFSQFYVQAFTPYHKCYSYSSGDDGFIHYDSRLFSVKLPNDWEEEEKYDFDWDQLKNQPDSFENFLF